MCALLSLKGNVIIVEVARVTAQLFNVPLAEILVDGKHGRVKWRDSKQGNVKCVRGAAHRAALCAAVRGHRRFGRLLQEST